MSGRRGSSRAFILLLTKKKIRPSASRHVSYASSFTLFVILHYRILDIDRWGGYLIGISSGSGGGDDDAMCPHLSIKFFGE